MTNRRHKNDTKTFEELSFEEQSKSISASINNLQKAIRAHTKKNKSKEKATRKKCLKQINRLLGRLLED